MVLKGRVGGEYVSEPDRSMHDIHDILKLFVMILYEFPWFGKDHDIVNKL